MMGDEKEKKEQKREQSKEKEKEKEEVDDLYWNEIIRNDCQINDISHSF